MLSAERIALLKHGAPPRNALEAALRNAWYGGGASYEKTVGPAPIISIADAKAKPAKSLIVGMEPIQDLHGYDSPWPAGGGKNILPDISRNSSGYNVSVSFNGNTATLTGLANSSGGRNVFRSDYFSLLAGTYYFKTYSNSSVKPSVYLQNDTSIVSADSDGMFTLSADSVKMNIGLNVTSGTDYNYTGTYLISTENVSEYSPYENLCPISGRTGVTVERTGKNLFEPTAWSDYMVHGVSFNGSDCTPLVSFLNTLPAGDYTISFTFDVETTVSGATSWGILLHRTSGYIDGRTSGQHNAGETLTFTRTVNITSANKGTFDHAYMYSGGGNKADVYMYAFQLQVGSTVTAYEPYVGATFPVTWQTEAGTVYGGTVDVVSGVLTVELASVDLGSLSWTASTAYTVNRFDAPVSDMTKSKESPYYDGILCSAYNPSNIPITAVNVDATIARYNGRVYVCDSRYATAEDFTEGVSGVQFVYVLDEPQTFTLTPQQIQMLKNENVLLSDGESLTLTYIGTQPAGLLGGMLGGGLGGAQEPTEETSEEPTEGENE